MNTSKIITLFFALTLIIMGCWYISVQRNKKNHAHAFKTEKPQRRDLMQYITATGTVKILDENQVSIGTLVTGRITEVSVHANDFVKKDQVLAIIDNGIGNTAVHKLEAILEQARARAQFQEQFYARQTKLYLAGQLSKNLYEQYTQDYNVARNTVKQNEAELQLEQKTYNNLFIRSPKDGLVIARNVDLGQTVVSQLNATVLFVIGDLHDMEAYTDVDEADIGLVKVNQEASFSVDAFPRELFNARVKRVEYQSKTVDNIITYPVVLDIKNNDLKLRPGMTTNTDIMVAGVNNTLSISNKALRVTRTQLEEAAKRMGISLKSAETKTRQLKFLDYVWVMRSTNSIEQVEVVIGINDGKYSQVIQGIDEHTDVIYDIDNSSRENKLLQGLFAQPSGIGK